MHRFWLGTRPSDDNGNVDLYDAVREHARGAVWQEECTEEGYHHVHVYLELKRTQRLTWLKNNICPIANWEPRRGTRAEAVAYVTKEETRVVDPVFFGDLDVHQGQRSDLKSACDALLTYTSLASVAADFPTVYVKYHRGLHALAATLIPPRTGMLEDRPTVTWIYGPTGVGKTRMAFQSAPDPLNVYFKDPTTKWWDGYVGQGTVVIDDYRSEKTVNGLHLNYLLRLLDIYPMMVEVKHGYINFNTPNIFITSNESVDINFPMDEQVGALKRRITNTIVMPE